MSTSNVTNLVSHECDRVTDAMRDAGAVFVCCDTRGRIVYTPPSNEWLTELLCRSPLVKNAIAEATATWNEAADPAPFEGPPGCWLLPAPVKTRRQCTGYGVAIVPARELLDSEHLSAMCQAAQVDQEVTRRMLVALPPVAAEDVPRLARLFAALHGARREIDSGQRSLESVGQQLVESYEEINLLYTIVQSMRLGQQPERFLSVVSQELLETLPFSWVAVMLPDADERLQAITGELVTAGALQTDPQRFRSIGRTLLGRAAIDTPVVVDPAQPDHAPFAALGGPTLVHPIAAHGRVIGLLMAGEKQGPERAITSVDMKLLGATASHIGIFIENATLYFDANAMFLGTLEALSSAIDAKDQYTCGHSQRVAALSQQLGEAIGLDAQTVERIHIAGILHDVGKIGVPEAVLCKPGRLTDDEFALIRLHPEIGHRILKDIPQLRDILPGVLHHHERWDGRGYPEGLEGDSIPLLARMMALADSFDAMSSDRTYRAARGRDEVLDEIIANAGTQFDPELAPLFVRLDFSEFDRLLREHTTMAPPSSRGEAA